MYIVYDDVYIDTKVSMHMSLCTVHAIMYIAKSAVFVHDDVYMGTVFVKSVLYWF